MDLFSKYTEYFWFRIGSIRTGLSGQANWIQGSILPQISSYDGWRLGRSYTTSQFTYLMLSRYLGYCWLHKAAGACKRFHRPLRPSDWFVVLKRRRFQYPPNPPLLFSFFFLLYPSSTPLLNHNRDQGPPNTKKRGCP